MHLLQRQSLRQTWRAGLRSHPNARNSGARWGVVRFGRLATAFLLVLTLALPAAADKAKGFYDKGRDAEARQNWEQAYEFYKQAYDLKPKELRYRAAFERSRFQAGASHVHRGQKLRDDGNLQQALVEFMRAAEIDPSSDIARQEIRRTQEMDKGKGPQAAAPSRVTDLGRMAAEAEGPAELKPISAVPITMRMTEDTKNVYTAVGKLAGVNVLFDPDYVSRRITIDLNNVSLYQALEIVALESKTFWRAVTPNTIFVATDTKAKRTEIEQNVVKTFYLANLAQTTEIQDVVNTLRTVVEITRVISLPTQNAIVIRGTPDQVALAEKLVTDLDKARPEVVVDIAVMQVSRDKLKNLGLSPPTSASIQLQNNVTPTTTTTGTTTTTTTTTPTTSGTTGLTLNKLANLTSNDFLVTIPGATANFLFTDSDTKIIQNPQIRALDGQKATLKIGDRVPVATGSFQPGIGGVGINPLVNTQFQYIDVGVNIDVQPTVHAAHEVTLKITMEVSSVSSHVNIGGIDQPVIGQRRVEHTIRLREGEVSLMGGMLEEDVLKSVNGYPWLSQVPILKYLFSSQNTERRTNEIVFVLIPHIIRGQDVNDVNLRAIEVGTANAIGLRRAAPKPSPNGNGGSASAARPVTAQAPAQPQSATGQNSMMPGAQAAPAQATPIPTQPAQAVPAPVPPQTGPAATQPPQGTSGAAIMSFDPPQVTPAVGSTFAVNVTVSGANNLFSVPVQLSYDPKSLQLLNVSNGSFLSRDGQPVVIVHREDGPGLEQVSATRPPGSGGVSGTGTVFTLTFMAKSAGQSTLAITRAGARDPAMQPVQVTPGQAMVTVK
ncbi:MAG TPA: cohesin domain-containing protein [Terriglobales bacterium]|nr:cohesin domain-containing protein [Terriglobales bacterium]